MIKYIVATFALLLAGVPAATSVAVGWLRHRGVT